ncbi:hypothetical protein WA158_000545 [Blastocystis sp. Blastoise]
MVRIAEFYNTFNSLLISPTLLNTISQDKIYEDAFSTKEYQQRTSDNIKNQRQLCLENNSYEGVKKRSSPFEDLSYFDIVSSFSIDTMHLFNNIVTLLLSLLFNFNSNHYSSLLSKTGSINAEDIISKYALNKDNMAILSTRITNVNTLHNKYEYEFRFILNEKKFSSVSSHTRIFFLSTILPLLLHDFTMEDSPIVLLIDPLATIIREIEYDRLFTINGNIDILKKQCYMFSFLCDLLLPKEIINSQIHLISHLSDSIQLTGSYMYGCTYESERYYSKIKRMTFGRQCFNESSIRSIVQDEIYLTTKSNEVYNMNDSQSSLNVVNSVEIIQDSSLLINPSYNKFEIVTFPNLNNIHSIKGIREEEEKTFDKMETYYLLKELILIGNESINRILFDNINVDLFENSIDLLKYDYSYDQLKSNLKQLPIFYYSEIFVNESIVFTSTEENEGIEAIDNSYIAYSIKGEASNHEIHLIKALYYIQIFNIILIRKHEYPISIPSTSRLYYIINESNEDVPIKSKYGSPFMRGDIIIPDNIIIADIHIALDNEDKDYREVYRKQKYQKEEEG